MSKNQWFSHGSQLFLTRSDEDWASHQPSAFAPLFSCASCTFRAPYSKVILGSYHATNPGDLQIPGFSFVHQLFLSHGSSACLTGEISLLSPWQHFSSMLNEGPCSGRARKSFIAGMWTSKEYFVHCLLRVSESQSSKLP